MKSPWEIVTASIGRGTAVAAGITVAAMVIMGTVDITADTAKAMVTMVGAARMEVVVDMAAAMPVMALEAPKPKMVGRVDVAHMEEATKQAMESIGGGIPPPVMKEGMDTFASATDETF